MLIPCKYCGTSINGTFKLHDHKVKAHPLEWSKDRLIGIDNEIERLKAERDRLINRIRSLES